MIKKSSRVLLFCFYLFLLVFNFRSLTFGVQPNFTLQPKKIFLNSFEKKSNFLLTISVDADIILRQNFIKFNQKRSGSVKKIPFTKKEVKTLYQYIGFDKIFSNSNKVYLKKGVHSFNIPLRFDESFDRKFPFVFQLGFEATLEKTSERAKDNIRKKIQIIPTVEKFFNLQRQKKDFISDDLVVENVSFVQQKRQCTTLDSELFIKRIKKKVRPLECFHYVAIQIRSTNISYILAKPFAHFYHTVSQRNMLSEKKFHLFYHQKYFKRGDLKKSYFLLYPGAKVDLVLPLFGSYLQGKYSLDLFFQRKGKPLLKKTLDVTLGTSIERSYDSPGNILWEGTKVLKTKACISQIKGQDFPKICPFEANIRGSFIEDIFVSPDNQFSVRWEEKGKFLMSFNPENTKHIWRSFKGSLIIKEKAQGKLPHHLRFKVFGRQGEKTRVRKIPIKVATF